MRRPSELIYDVGLGLLLIVAFWVMIAKTPSLADIRTRDLDQQHQQWEQR